MLKLIGTHKDGTIADERILLDANDRPTPLLIGLAVAELALDCLVAFAIYNLLKNNK